MTDMRVDSREFQRDFARMKAKAAAGETGQLIVATALVHGLRLVSDDTRIRQWGRVPLLWRTARQ
jgi:predicted nucleic acid-binding protein